MTEETAQFEFDSGFQAKVAALCMRDSRFMMQTKDILNPDYFTSDAHKMLVKLVHEHAQVYKCAPDVKTVPQILRDAIAKKRIRPDLLLPVKEAFAAVLKADVSNPDYIQDQVTTFAKTQAIQDAMMKSLPLLEKGEFGKIEKVFRDAISVGSVKDDGDYDYWEEVKNRTQERIDLRNGKKVRKGITTGYSMLDGCLYHYGWGRKELSCILGAAKAGKSMSLGDFGKNAALTGYNVFYDSLEVSRKIISDRIDAALSNTLMRNLNTSAEDVEAAIMKAQAKSGKFKMRDHPSGTLKPSQLHNLLEKYRADGIIFDLVIVDYADIMAAEYRSDSLQENLRTIYVDLRALAHEHDCALLTATQTNREGAKAATAKATDVGDDWNKARTVDIMIGINATDEEKAAGEARLTWLLSRNTESGFSIRVKQDRQKMQFIKEIIGRE